MATTTASKNLRNRDGRWAPTKSTHLCKVCGQTRGIHDAEKPYAMADMTQGEVECEGFKASRTYLVWVPEKWEVEG